LPLTEECQDALLFEVHLNARLVENDAIVGSAFFSDLVISRSSVGALHRLLFPLWERARWMSGEGCFSVGSYKDVVNS